MFFDFFKRRGGYVDVEVKDGKGVISKKNRWLIFVIIAAIFILALGGSGGRDKKEKEISAEPADTLDSQYIADMEERLCGMLATVKGAGRVKVMLSFDNIGEKILAKNSKDQLESEVGDESSANKSSVEENIMVIGSGTEEAPFVVKEKLPLPSGVLVTATGAGNEHVKLEIYEAVKALYGISPHRIRVTAAAEK